MQHNGLTIEKYGRGATTEWWGERDGKPVTFEFPTRASLIAAIDGGYAELVDGHALITWHRNLGTRPIAGCNTSMRGTAARSPHCPDGHTREGVTMQSTTTHDPAACPTCRRLARNVRRHCRTGHYALVADRCGDHEAVASVDPEAA